MLTRVESVQTANDQAGRATRDWLLVFFLHRNWLKVLGFENLAAVETFHVVDAVSSRNDLGAGMLTSGMHRQRLDEIYSNRAYWLVKPPLQG